MSKSSFYFASCPREMETFLEQEIQQLGVAKTKICRGGVQFEARPKAALEILLSSRIASRVWLEVAFFQITGEKGLYAEALKLPWFDWMDLEQTFKIQTLLDRDAKKNFKSSVYLSQLLKDGLCDAFKNKSGERPSVELDYPDLQFLLRIEQGRGKKWVCKILMDLCGEPLSNRGYRPSGHQAPLRENLAAALIMASDWNPESEKFYDSMCGTGTIIIEAMLIAAKIRPSWLKVKKILENDEVPYSFQTQNWFMNDDELVEWFQNRAKQINDHSQSALKELTPDRFFGNDVVASSLEKTIKGVTRAGFAKNLVTLTEGDATKLLPPFKGPGVVFCNPPYGERMGDKAEVNKLYHEYGENLKKNFSGFRAYILTSDSELRKAISLQTSARIPFYNGNLECRLLKYDLY